MKIIFAFLTLVLFCQTSLAFDTCRTREGRMVGVGTVEKIGRAIYIQGRGYYKITRTEGTKSISEINGRVISVDLAARTLIIDKEAPVRLSGCRHSDSE